LDEHVACVEALIAQAEEILAEAYTARLEQKLTRASGGASAQSARSAGEARSHEEAHGGSEAGWGGDAGEASSSGGQEARAAEAARLLSRLPPDVADEERTRIEVLAQEQVQADGGPAVGLALRYEVQQAITRAERRRADKQHAVRLRSQVAPFLDQQQAAEIDRALATVTEEGQPLTAQLRRDAANVAAACAIEQDRRIAAAAAAETFRELGYEVEEGFETLAAQRGVAHVTKPGWHGYAVQFRLQENMMRFHVVGEADRARSPSAAATRDREVQEAWCQDVEPVRERMKNHGVRFAVTEQTEPGEVKVQETSGSPWSIKRQSKSAERSRRQEQQR
jgi:hypothetical protein